MNNPDDSDSDSEPEDEDDEDSNGKFILDCGENVLALTPDAVQPKTTIRTITPMRMKTGVTTVVGSLSHMSMQQLTAFTR